MTKQQFKEKFIKNLRFYLEDDDVGISMRVFRKGEHQWTDTATSSVRGVVHKGIAWRVEVKKPLPGLAELVLLAHYKTVGVEWEYRGKYD